jgi:hypothetical protein
MLSFTKGQFALDPPEERKFAEPLDLGATEVLMEGIRQVDELATLKDRIPPPDAMLSLPKTKRLRDLAPEDLDWAELVLRGRTFAGTLDASAASDIDTARALVGLIERGVLVVGS